MTMPLRSHVPFPWRTSCAKIETECAVLNADSVRFSRPTGGQHATFEHPSTRGKLEQVLGNWEESDEGGKGFEGFGETGHSVVLDEHELERLDGRASALAGGGIGAAAHAARRDADLDGLLMVARRLVPAVGRPGPRATAA